MTSRSRLTRRAFLAFRLNDADAPAAAATAADFALSSYALACAQVNEARPFLADEARRYGIPTENRTDIEVLRDVFAKARLPAD